MHFPFNVNEMALLSSTATSRANKRCREDESTSQDKYTFQGKHLNSQTKHLLMNVVEYFKKEAKKSKMFLKEYQKQPVRQSVLFKLFMN